jgi:hypothetical protein
MTVPMTPDGDADDRGQDADVLSTVDQQPCDCAGDQSDD